MSQGSKIEWTETTWNPAVGCSKVSAGCDNCYANALHERLHRMGSSKYKEPFETVRPWPVHLEEPFKWKTPQIAFVNSMSDLFHKDLPVEYIKQVFDVMRRAEKHTFQVLTKRANRLPHFKDQLPWAKNVWMGVSVEDVANTWRIQYLQEIPAAVRFLSVEPLLGPIPSLPLDGIDWVIVGGESGVGARPMEPAWVRDIRDQCVAARVPFFFKQWGKLVFNPDRKDPTARGDDKAKGGRQLDSRTWDEMPVPKVRWNPVAA